MSEYVPDSTANALTPLDGGGYDEVSDPVAATIKLFNDGQLLARVLAPADPVDNYPGLAYPTWDEALPELRAVGRHSESTTLLMPGCPVPLYLYGSGILIAASEAEVVHVADSDSGSRGSSADGTFEANATQFTDLAGLRTAVMQAAEEHRGEMNEVNVDYDLGAIKGILVHRASADRPAPPKAVLEALCLQRYLQGQGIDLPLFRYTQRGGMLESYQLNTDGVQDLLNQIGYVPARERYRQFLEV